jgi:hypothetical protein
MIAVDVYDDGKGKPNSVRVSAEIDPECIAGTFTARVWAESETEGLEKIHDRLLELSSDVSREIQTALDETRERCK